MVEGTDGGLPAETKSGFQSMLMSFMVILVSEIGDKTFLIAAVMAMQHSRHQIL